MLIVKLKTNSIPYTYILEWTQQNKRYIGARWANGCHPSDLWSSYFTSSSYVKQFVEIYGKPDVILIDQTFDNAMDAMNREKELQNKYDIKNNDSFLNKAICGVFNFYDPEIRDKMAESRKGRKLSEKHKENIGSKMKGRVYKPETIEKMKLAHIGKTKSAEQIASISLALQGNKRRKGTKTSDQGRKNIGLAKLGTKHSNETRAKMSKSHAGKKQNIVTCPHCKKQGGAPAMGQWHFNNCKQKGV